MECMTISEVSKSFSVSTRTLRYYEQIGLITSLRREGYAYRIYDEDAVRRLQQILILRRLRIPLRQIRQIYQEKGSAKLVEVFEEHISDIDAELLSLRTIRTALRTLLSQLRLRLMAEPDFDPLEDTEVKNVIETLLLSKPGMKEEPSMDLGNVTNKVLSKIHDVRILYLPPCTVAACRYVGEAPEERAGAMLEEFVKKVSLYEKKPDARMFGFNSPNPSPARPHHGYECWITIPEDLELEEPMVKKRFSGGMYAAHKIMLGDFHEWDWLNEWVSHSEKYTSNFSGEGEANMSGCLEEGINWLYHSHQGWPDGHEPQLDLLLPIRLK